MLRILQVFCTLGILALAVPAVAQEPNDQPASNDAQPAAADATPTASEGPSDQPAAAQATSKPAVAETPAGKVGPSAEAAPVLPAPVPEEKPTEQPESWHTFVTGYFRAPMSMGLSPRPGPDSQAGPARMQISYGPNRLVDASYYSFAYTRLQEQDWAELFVHAKKKHAEAVVGWMGYWFQAIGFRNPDASWAPGMAYLTLDTDLELGDTKPNIAFTAGAFWPKFGYAKKYDTYTLGQMRQLGEQVRLTLPINDLRITFTHGFGTSRDGSYNNNIGTAPPIYGATTGLDLLHYENLQFAFQDYVDLGLHFNTQWTRDPNLTQLTTTMGPKSYDAASKAYLLTLGGELTLKAPYAGSLWISPSYIRVRNGWALGNGGVEVMHSLAGAGLAANYFGWTNSVGDSTASGTLMNLGFLYENTLSGVQGKPVGSVMPEVTLNVFGLMANATLENLPSTTSISQTHIRQFKYGADLTVQPLTWLGVMGRYDQVNYDLNHPGYVFSAITGRLIFSSHFLSSESIYIQYSRYRYGEKMVLNGQWPWGQELVAGNGIIQHGTYAGQKPDMDVFKVQANVAF